MWHLGSQRDVRVNPNATKVQSLAKAHRRGVVLGPDTRCQTILHVVGVTHCFFSILEFLDGDNWTKNFALDVLILLLQS